MPIRSLPSPAWPCPAGASGPAFSGGAGTAAANETPPTAGDHRDLVEYGIDDPAGRR